MFELTVLVPVNVQCGGKWWLALIKRSDDPVLRATKIRAYFVVYSENYLKFSGEVTATDRLIEYFYQGVDNYWQSQ